jgi:hypothetical protein
MCCEGSGFEIFTLIEQGILSITSVSSLDSCGEFSLVSVAR